MQGHATLIKALAFDSSGRIIASASEDGLVRIWNAQTGESLHSLSGHQHAVWAIRFHPFRNRLYSAGWDRTVRIWDVESGQCLHVLDDYPALIMDLAVSPQGDQIVAAGAMPATEGYLQSWNAETGAPLRRFNGHERDIVTVSISPDGRRLVSGGADGQVKLWDMATGSCLLTWDANQCPITSETIHNNFVVGVAFHPDGQRITVQTQLRGIMILDTRPLGGRAHLTSSSESARLAEMGPRAGGH
jgi:WD40 repeat protein